MIVVSIRFTKSDIFVSAHFQVRLRSIDDHLSNKRIWERLWIDRVPAYPPTFRMLQGPMAFAEQGTCSKSSNFRQHPCLYVRPQRAERNVCTIPRLLLGMPVITNSTEFTEKHFKETIFRHREFSGSTADLFPARECDENYEKACLLPSEK
jgi:hypothetical protein